MVVGGNIYKKAELIDLSGQNLNCPDISDYPVESGSVGTFINGKAMVCGGDSGPEFNANCSSYNMQVSKFVVIRV